MELKGFYSGGRIEVKLERFYLIFVDLQDRDYVKIPVESLDIFSDIAMGRLPNEILDGVWVSLYPDRLKMDGPSGEIGIKSSEMDRLVSFINESSHVQEQCIELKPHLPEDAQERKSIPIATGFLDYFPDAIIEVANLSFIGNEQHNPGMPMFWDRSKSTDHADCLMRHFIDREKVDSDGVLHATKVAWRALAYLQVLLENRKGE